MIEQSVNAEDATAAKQLLTDGFAAERKLDRWTAIEAYQKAFELDPTNPKVCFRLAYNLDLVGQEEESLDLYEQCCSMGAASLNALVNLAIMYEDQSELTKAERCLILVLDANPNHERARLYLRDVRASRRMYYDETPDETDRHDPLYDTPVTDFELSVRARNCLKKMNVRTLGDLLRISEAELMGYKNFGETSLTEIRSVLAQRGLRLGQGLEEQQTAARQQVYEELRGSGTEESLVLTMEELNLSARAHKALSLLSIETVGDLISRTEAELLGVKNFGSTSLDEIKEKLAEHGLKLRELDE